MISTKVDEPTGLTVIFRERTNKSYEKSVKVIKDDTIYLAFLNYDEWDGYSIVWTDDNYKDILMRYCQSHKYKLPEYHITSHVNGIFNMIVVVNNQYMGTGVAKNKKQAEQISAYHTLKFIGQIV